MADLSQLGNLQPIEPLTLDQYADNKESTFQLPRKGRYQVRAPESFPATAFSRTKKTKALSVQIDPTIVGPSNEGFQIKFTRVSATPFKRDGITVSQLGDYLRAAGVGGTLKTEQDLGEAVEQTANKVYEVDIDWRAYSNKGGQEFKVEGMESFPRNPDGTYQSWVKHPSEKDENGEPLRVRANLVIDRYVPAA